MSFDVDSSLYKLLSVYYSSGSEKQEYSVTNCMFLELERKISVCFIWVRDKNKFMQENIIYGDRSCNSRAY